MMIRAVIDTNVFISSFFGGNPRKVIGLWKKGAITLCLSKPILEEYTEVLLRMGLKNTREMAELLQLFADGHHLLFTTKTGKFNIVEKDPDDNKFIECAVALKAQWIVSGDKALLEVERFMGVQIVAPKEFLEQFNKKH
jgi:uncharacterized protein